MKTDEKPKPIKTVDVGAAKLRIEGLGPCCHSSMRLYIAQGGNDSLNATHTCLGCGAVMIRRKDAWEKSSWRSAIEEKS